jgi:hypothetical protein
MQYQEIIPNVNRDESGKIRLRRKTRKVLVLQRKIPVNSDLIPCSVA